MLNFIFHMLLLMFRYARFNVICNKPYIANMTGLLKCKQESTPRSTAESGHLGHQRKDDDAQQAAKMVLAVPTDRKLIIALSELFDSI
jgi:hypothetical protein